jgi:hypothetical protein
MVILVKISISDQLHMGVESLEPTIHSVFFALKNSVTMAEQNKLHMESFYMGAILQ